MPRPLLKQPPHARMPIRPRCSMAFLNMTSNITDSRAESRDRVYCSFGAINAGTVGLGRVETALNVGFRLNRGRRRCRRGLVADQFAVPADAQLKRRTKKLKHKQIIVPPHGEHAKELGAGGREENATGN
jgi:hypothetical protein